MLIFGTVAAALAATSVPRIDFLPESSRGGPLTVIVPGGAGRTRLLAIAPASDRDGATVVTSAHDIVSRVETDFAPDAFVVQDRLAAAAATGRVALLLDERGWVERPVRRSPLLSSFYLLAAIGLFGGIVGLWVLAALPHRLAAWGVAASGIGLWLAVTPIGVQLNAEFIVGGSTARWLLACNYIGTQVFAAGFMLLFARYPKPLLPARPVIGAVAATLLAMVLMVWAEPVPPLLAARLNLFVLLDFVTLVTLVVLQWRAARRDPVGRGYLRLVGTTWVLALGVWVATTVIPQLAGRAPLIDPATGFLLMIPPYAAMAVGIMRGVMFDIDAWAGRLLVSAVTVAALVAIETALVVALGLGQGPAASLAFLVVGLGWLVTRHRLLDRLLGRRQADDLRLLSEAHRIVLGSTAAQRAANWQEALRAAYRPLEIVPLAPAVAATTVAEGGLALHVAPPRFAPDLLLRSAREGRVLFRRHDADLLDQLRLLCDRIDDDRMAYDRGMQAERGRIAQDLHDDVSGRLLTSLHRDRPDLMRSDVRAALLDIRSIVSGLEGRERTLSDMLGDLRRECGERLVSTGVALDWRTDDDAANGWMLDYATYRAINAIAREITSNIIRHAGAKTTTMIWRVDDAAPALLLVACDDGVGLGDAPAGSGRRNIAARARALGGDVSFTCPSPPTTGTRIELTMPLPPQTGGVRSGVSSGMVATVGGGER